MEVAAATAIFFHTLSRRELQALCKRNGVRANMTNAAMAEALQSLPSVDGINEIGTTLCLPTPGKSTMKSALKAAAAIGEDEQQQQQHGSPLPRGRRVSVMSPEAVRMDVEDGEDEMKRDLGKEIVRTPGVALRSTSRRARATPAPIPTPAASTVRASTRRTAASKKTEEVAAAATPATLRRNQRTAAKKAPAPVEEVTTTKRTTRRSRSKVMIDLDKEVEEVAAALQEVKVQEENPKDVTSDEKCDDPEEEEATKILEGGDGKEEESDQGGEVSDKSCDDPKDGEMIATGEESAKTKEVEGAGKGQELIRDDSAPLPIMEDSPILGVLSKPEPVEPLSEKVEDDLDEESSEYEYAYEATEENASNETGESDPSEVATDSDEKEVEMLQVTMKDGLPAEINQADDEEDDFSSDLPPEFDCAGDFNDAETESDTTVVTSAAAKVTEASSEEVSQQKLEPTLDTIVKSLDEFTFTVEDTKQDELTEEMNNTDAEAVGTKVLKKKKKLTVEELKAKSLRKLKSMLKEAKAADDAGGKRLALAELDDNASVENGRQELQNSIHASAAIWD